MVPQTVSDNYEVTIPEDVQHAMDLKPGEVLWRFSPKEMALNWSKIPSLESLRERDLKRLSLAIAVNIATAPI